jgi:hypothetical protein
MPDDTDASRAVVKIRLQIEALDVAIDALMTLRDANQLDSDYANARIDQLDSRQSDLRDEMRTIILTGAVSQPPGQKVIDDLRARVDALRNFNVSAQSIQGMLDEALAIAGTMTLTHEKSMNVQPAAPKSAATPLAFGVGLAAGAALLALLGVAKQD